VPAFGKASMFHKVMQILEAHHFRMPACRFVLDLFDKRVLQQIVLDEDEDDDDEDGGEDEGEDDDSSESGSEPEANRTGSAGGTKAI
jgi:rapamycin-insensitive companion of mTOR